jgi:hypothetical protein
LQFSQTPSVHPKLRAAAFEMLSIGNRIEQLNLHYLSNRFERACRGAA